MVNAWGRPCVNVDDWRADGIRLHENRVCAGFFAKRHVFIRGREAFNFEIETFAFDLQDAGWRNGRASVIDSRRRRFFRA
jgi:hypothetical protein